MCGCLSHVPHWGPGMPGLQPRHVPLLGIELETLWFTAHTQSTELHQPGLVVSFLKIHFIDYAIAVVLIFPPLSLSTWYPLSLHQSPPLSSCSGVIHVSSLGSPFPILDISLFCTYQSYFLIPAPFTPFSPFPTLS